MKGMKSFNGQRAFLFLELKRIRLREKNLYNRLRVIEKRIERLKLIGGV